MKLAVASLGRWDQQLDDVGFVGGRHQAVAACIGDDHRQAREVQIDTAAVDRRPHQAARIGVEVVDLRLKSSRDAVTEHHVEDVVGVPICAGRGWICVGWVVGDAGPVGVDRLKQALGLARVAHKRRLHLLGDLGSGDDRPRPRGRGPVGLAGSIVDVFGKLGLAIEGRGVAFGAAADRKCQQPDHDTSLKSDGSYLVASTHVYSHP